MHIIYFVQKVKTVKNNKNTASSMYYCWLRVREIPGSIPSQGPRHTNDVIKMVPVVPLFWHSTSTMEILALSEEKKIGQKICDTNPSKSEVIGRCGADENTE